MRPSFVGHSHWVVVVLILLAALDTSAVVVGSASSGAPTAAVPTATSSTAVVGGDVCIMWRQTGACRHNGPREPALDRDCAALIAPAVSGYCECAGGVKTGLGDCGHDPWSCQDLCEKAFRLREPGAASTRCKVAEDGSYDCEDGEAGAAEGDASADDGIPAAVKAFTKLMKSIVGRIESLEEAIASLQRSSAQQCSPACLEHIAHVADGAARGSQSELKAQHSYLAAAADEGRRLQKAAEELAAQAAELETKAAEEALAKLEQPPAPEAQPQTQPQAQAPPEVDLAKDRPPTPRDDEVVDGIGNAPATPHTDPSDMAEQLSLSAQAREEARQGYAADVQKLKDAGILIASQLPELPQDSAMCDRALAVRRAFEHAWSGYKLHAWGHDTIKPMSKKPAKDFIGMGLSIVDALDTMLIMGLPEAYSEAREWVAAELKYDRQENINLFELTIRVTGGLLAAYELSGDKMFLEHAKAVGSNTLFAFESKSGLPYGTIGLRSRKKYNPSAHKGGSTISEVGTLALELAALSWHTNMPVFLEKADGIARVLHGLEADNGLYPMYISPDTGELMESAITLGARGDSLYEYLLKQWLIWGNHRGDRDWIREMYDKSVDGVLRVLLQRSTPSDLFYIAEQPRKARGTKLRPKMDHLVCFFPGVLALGVYHSPPSTSQAERDRNDYILSVAEELMWSCYQFYVQHPTGLAPEIVTFAEGKDFEANRGAKHSLLRPETVESLFVLWRVTGKTKYREWGWNIFRSIEKHARVEAGYSGLNDVTTTAAPKNDHMESFFLSETLKYLYLLFSDPSLIPLSEFVFNTEGHPLRMFKWMENGHKAPLRE